MGDLSEPYHIDWGSPPVISGLPDRSLNEDTSLYHTIDLWAYASDAETPDSGLSFDITNVTNPSCGVSIASNRYIDINPAANWYGICDVTVRVRDPGRLSATDDFRVTVNPVNDAPWISPVVPDQSAATNTAMVIDLTPYEHDIEDSGTSLDWYVTGENNCTVGGAYSDNDVLTFTPDAGFVGSDTVTLHLVDSGGSEATQDVTLTWVGPNRPPTLAWTGEPNYMSDGLHPESGGTADDYVYRINYIDNDGDAPNYVQVHIKKGGADIIGSPFDMSCASGDYTAGVICSYTKAGLEAGTDYTYYFVAEDDQANPAEPTTELDAPDVSAGPPASILLVDDDMGSGTGAHVESVFQNAITSNGYSYDYWDTEVSGSPSLSTLEGYEVVIWFTGGSYEGFGGRTIHPSDETALAAFLDGGGKLFLSSQDFLWDNGRDGFATDYLHIGVYTDDVGTSTVTGVPGDPVGDGLGSYSLSYPFTDWSDRVYSDGLSSEAFTNENGGPNALTYADSSYQFKVVFFGFPFAALNGTDATEVMERILNWFEQPPFTPSHWIYLPLIIKNH